MSSSQIDLNMFEALKLRQDAAHKKVSSLSGVYLDYWVGMAEGIVLLKSVAMRCFVASVYGEWVN